MSRKNWQIIGKSVTNAKFQFGRNLSETQWFIYNVSVTSEVMIPVVRQTWDQSVENSFFRKEMYPHHQLNSIETFI